MKFNVGGPGWSMSACTCDIAKWWWFLEELGGGVESRADLWLLGERACLWICIILSKYTETERYG